MSLIVKLGINIDASYLLENTKNIQAANPSASLSAEKLNFPILIAIVFSNVRGKSRKFSNSFFRTKKKKEAG